MNVGEFFEKLAPIISLHYLNRTTYNHKMRIKIYDGGGMSGGYFTVTGDVSLRGGNISPFELTSPFANAYLGKQICAEVRTVSVRDLEVKNWELEESEEDEDRLLLTVEIDNRIK